MDSHPQVMTVSYGTFSCTLDGFDDPFTTMQLVAEYFRKLSADDRYFGSEPLQPDASKLHQIAKSANPNRIDAEISDNSIILRQADVIDAPAKAEDIETEAPVAQETETEETTAVEDAPESVVEETPESKDVPTAFSSRRTTEINDALADATEVETDKPTETSPDALVASLEETINDTTTADELAPSLEEEIPSQTVSAAVKALKSGEAVDRWLETANEKMAAPEHVSKANALERLKAAVAATEAERNTRMETISSEVVQANEERSDNTISFRRELAKVRKAYERETSVFSRPKARSSAGGSNGATRPLVLDLGQRIDRNRQASDQQADSKKKSELTLVSDQDAPPQKVKSTPGNKPTSQTAKDAGEAILRHPKISHTVTPANHKGRSDLPSFDVFSKAMGASTLIELLEASAAYMTLVLGKDSYTEPQISANLPEHIKSIVKDDECVDALGRLSKRGFVENKNDGSFAISLSRKAAYQKKYLAS